MVELLIKNHSDVDAVDILHRTPLYISIEGNHNKIVEVLILYNFSYYSKIKHILGQPKKQI